MTPAESTAAEAMAAAVLHAYRQMQAERGSISPLMAALGRWDAATGSKTSPPAHTHTWTEVTSYGSPRRIYRCPCSETKSEPLWCPPAQSASEGQGEPTPGLYRHFKGGLYDVLGTARHSETGESMVLYRSREHGMLNVRPLAMWAEHVERDGYAGPRFQRVSG